MGKSSNINIRIDESLKKNADNLFEDLGISMSSAINIFLKQTVREQKIPFEIKREYPNYDTEMAIVEQSDEGSKVYDSVDELFEDLDKWNIKLKHLNYLKETIN